MKTILLGERFRQLGGGPSCPNFEGFEKYTGNPLTLPFYGADGVVHPDVIYFPDGVDGYKYWMVYTPYPPNDKENPSIVRSNDGINWVDTDITNPVIAHAGWVWSADPDMIYIASFNKWFMVWMGNTGSYHYKIAFAYSSDGKNWTEYDGVTINGNTNPVILNGEDDNGEAWEYDTGPISRLGYPTLLYEDGIFYLFYGSLDGNANNRGKMGYATFTWNNETNDIENFQRYASNPIMYLDADGEFKSGHGHYDISKYNNTYYIYCVREMLGSSNFELALVTSTDKINWTNRGKVLGRGSSGEWDDNHVYRSSTVTDGVGNVVLFSLKVKLYYSGYEVSVGPKIGYALSDCV